MTWRQKLFSNLLPKTAILLIVTAFWALITSRQGQITTVTAPVRLQGIADELVLVRSFPEEVDVQLKSFSSLTPAPAKLDISATIDLSGVHEGTATVRIKNSDFSLPSGMVVTSVTPSSIKVVTEKKMRKTVPVRVQLKGALASGLGGYEAISDPQTIDVVGPAGQVSRIESVATEEIDAGRLARNKEYRKNLLLPSKMVTLLYDEPVLIKVVPRRKRR
jgi:diadenylate cyclase